MGIWNELKNAFEGISNANKEFREGVRQDFVETKRDIISDWKREVPNVGNTMEKVDRALTTFKNVKEQLPDLSSKPFNPKIKLKNEKKTNYKDLIELAQHLKVNRLGYSHHALSLSPNEVIHYQEGRVKIDTIENFTKGASIQVIETPRLYNKEKIIARAYSKLGERQYNLLFNNCEHFVKWTMNGD